MKTKTRSPLMTLIELILLDLFSLLMSKKYHHRQSWGVGQLIIQERNKNASITEAITSSTIIWTFVSGFSWFKYVASFTEATGNLTSVCAKIKAATFYRIYLACEAFKDVIDSQKKKHFFSYKLFQLLNSDCSVAMRCNDFCSLSLNFDNF